MLTIYPWQQTQWQQLLNMREQNRLPHALLLTGPEGIGLNHFARVFAASLLCLSRTAENVSCGTCQSCQLFTAGNHPDMVFIEPEEQGKQIKIAQIRELIDYVALKSFSGDAKIAIIDPADAMNRATANALLKTLEEPPAQSKLLLISHRPENLPITIRSRCQRIDFQHAFDEASSSWLQQNLDQTEMPPELLLKLSAGGPLKAITLIEEEQLDIRQTLLSDLKRLRKQGCNPVQIAADWQSIGVENVLSWLMKVLLDLIKLKLLKDRASLMNLDLKEDLQDLVNSLDLLALVRSYDFVLLKYQQSSGPMNYNPLSILEEIVLFWNSPEYEN